MKDEIEGETRLQVISINVSKEIIDFIKILTDEIGIFPSRSDAIRWCVYTMIPSLLRDLGQIKSLIQKEDHISARQFLEIRGYNIKKDNAYNCKYRNNGITDNKPLGNPYWDQYSDAAGKIHYVSKEDPNVIRIPLGNGEYKEIRKLGEA